MMETFADKFSRDLADGKSVEAEVADFLRGRGHRDVTLSDGYFPDFDIRDGTGKTWEVKADFASRKTDNYFIEFRCAGKPSGLAATKADTFVIVVDEKMVFIPTAELKLFLRRHWNALRKVDKVGDGGKVEGVLLPKRYANRMSMVGTEEFVRPPP